LAHQDKALLLMQSLFYDTHFWSPKFTQHWGKERFAGRSAMAWPRATAVYAPFGNHQFAQNRRFLAVEARFNPRHCL
jgi:hypothetical protein